MSRSKAEVVSLACADGYILGGDNDIDDKIDDISSCGQ